MKVCNMGLDWAGSAYNERVEFQNGVNGVVGCEGWIEDAKTMWVSSSSISEPPLRRMRQNM